MKIKKCGITSLLIIMLLINNIISQVTVYPEHYLESDSPYSTSSLYLSTDIKERQIYKLLMNQVQVELNNHPLIHFLII